MQIVMYSSINLYDHRIQVVTKWKATVRMFIVDGTVPMIYERLEMHHRSSVPFDRLRIDTVEDASHFGL